MNLIKHYIFSIILILCTTNIKAQNKKDNLDIDFGIGLLKLGENYSEVVKKIELYPYTCNYCEKTDSISKKYSIKSLDKIIIEGVTTDRASNLYFINDFLYKIEINLPNSELVQQKLSRFFIERYGIENKKNGVLKVWETKKTYLEVYIPNLINDDNKFLNVTMFSRELNDILNKDKNELNNKTPEILSSINNKKGKGNSSFIPDVNNSFKLLQNKTSPKKFENLLPAFTVKNSFSECSSYNVKTNEVVQNKCLKSQYSFMSKDEVLVNVEVTSQNDEINRFEYFFDVKQKATEFKNQIIKNGFIYDSRLTKVFIKLGFRFCLAYTKKPGYTFVYYNENKFTISK